MTENLPDFFEKQIAEATKARSAIQKKYNVIAILRIFYFLAAVVATVYVTDKVNAWLGILLGFILLGVFAYIIRLHLQIGWKKKYYNFIEKVNENELYRLQGNFKKIEDSGEDFLEADHPYALDLDLFGSTSLFTLLNRTATVNGRHLLAGWLGKKTDVKTIQLRQKAIEELKPLAEFRHAFQAKGQFHKGKQEEIDNLLRWVNTEASELHTNFTKIIAWLLPALVVAGTFAFFYFEDVPGIVIALPLFINFLILGKYRKTVTALCEDTVKSARILKTYVNLFKAVENEQLNSELLTALQSKMHAKNEKASEAIKKLGRILTNLEVRDNVYFAFTVNLATLYEIHWALALEKWKADHEDSIKDWFEALADFDVLQSMAGYAFLNPSFTQARFVDTPYAYKATTLGHPLIHSSKRVCNDFELQGKGKTILITGSNMSGKSTFLRTLGVNAVLAFMGAPVCASRFSIYPCQLFTSMRIQDSLEENTSAFYAELKRIKLMFKTIERCSELDEPVFFLLDEVLKGTNSKDRHLGVNAILKQLFEKNCFGLLSTHDLELNQLADQYPQYIVNRSFNSAIVNNQLHFDYKLHAGMCHSFSASKLMEGLGILGEGTVE